MQWLQPIQSKKMYSANLKKPGDRMGDPLERRVLPCAAAHTRSQYSALLSRGVRPSWAAKNRAPDFATVEASAKYWAQRPAATGQRTPTNRRQKGLSPILITPSPHSRFQGDRRLSVSGAPRTLPLTLRRLVVPPLPSSPLPRFSRFLFPV